VHHKGALEQSCSRSPTNYKKHIRKRKGMGNLKEKKAKNLKESSLAMMVHFRIEVV
jgi:hypothetical protein